MVLIKKLIKEEFEKFENQRKFDLKIVETLRCENLFNDTTIDESDNTEREKVINLIKNNQWEEQNPNDFYHSLKQSEHPLMLTDYTPQELSKMKLFKLKDYNIGFALKKFEDKGYSEIVAVHNNEPEIKGIGEILVQATINNGGCYLYHFDGFLSDLYGRMGFIEINRDKYNSEYDPEGRFMDKYGDSDILHRVHKNCR